jgi:hypothetical protein
MFDLSREGTPSLFGGARPRLSPFGRIHYHEHEVLPLSFVEILASNGTTRTGTPAASDRSTA